MEVYQKVKSFRSRRALSPIFATLILIAIAVIAGIVVYMFTSGTLASMMGGGTTGQEKVAIQAIQGPANPAAAGNILLYAQSTGGGDVAIDTVIVKFAGNASIVKTYTGASVVTGGPIKSTLTTITVVTAANDLKAGETYTVTLVTVAGNQVISPSFKA